MTYKLGREDTLWHMPKEWGMKVAGKSRPNERARKARYQNQRNRISGLNGDE